MTKATTNVARVAAAVAGLGLVAMSLAPIASAQTSTTTTTTTTSSASVTFTRDLTVGSTGADVTALQTWLIGKGYSIPAGATGYFGSQTKAAVAAFQAANLITPAVGYFGPITRAKVASMGGSSSSTGSTVPGCLPGYAFSSTTGAPCGSSTGSTGGSTGGLTGGEATFSNFQLNAGNDLSQGDTNSEIAVAQFDVKNGDVNLQRVTVDLQPSSSSYNLHPWSYIQTLSVYDGSKKIGSVDVSSKADWNQESAGSGADFGSGQDYYSVDVPVNDIVRQGDNNQLSIRADAQDTIDTANNNQTFNLIVPTNGIRAVDAAGIQEYTGSDSSSNTVTVGFNAEQAGKLTISTGSDNPGAGVLVADDTNTSDSYDVLAFSIKNSQDTDVDLDTMKFTVATSSAATSTGASSIKSIIRSASLDLGGDTYTGTINSDNTISFNNLNTTVNGNDSVDGTLSVTLYGQTNHFAPSGESLTFSLSSSNVTAESSNNGDTSSVSGSATGKTQTIGVNSGITVDNTSSTQTESYNSTTPSASTGSFALTFDVTANGSDDVYIPKTIVAEASTSVDTTHGVAVADDLGASTVGTTSVSLSSSAATDPDNSGYYIVHAGSKETFTANVTMDPSAAGYYQIGLNEVNYTTVSTGGSLQNLNLNPNDYSSGQLYIHG